MAELQDDIEKYLSGKMTPAEMHAFERKALDDPFLSEALEGAGSISHADLTHDINAIHERLHDRTKRRSGSLKLNWPLRIAAAFLLLAASVFVIVMLTDRTAKTGEQLALKKEAEKTTSPGSAPLSDSSDANRTINTEQQSPAEAVTKDAPAKTPLPTTTQEVEVPQDAASGAAMELQEIVTEPAEAELQEADETEEKPTIIAADAPSPVSGPPETAVLDADKKIASSQPAASRKEVRNKMSISRQNTAVITGQVVDAEDGEPIPGVSVIVKETSIGTVTDIDGNYELTLPDPRSQLVFSFIGFATSEVPAEGKNVLDVRLNPDIQQLSEVVVTGYDGGQIPEGVTWELATPDGGHKAYYKYLEENLVYPPEALANKIEGKVTVRFSVEPDGQLSNFKVVKSLGYGCDEEVIRLIKEGPKWSPTKRNNEPVVGRVKVKVKFRLPG